jgi:hypothetical protein
MKMHFLSLAPVAGLLLPERAAAEQFQPVRDQSTFLEVVEGRDLTRFGIRVEVSPSGEIRGRAFGSPVTGAWRWQDGYFCRDLFWGDRDLGPNCQEVRVNGNRVRFISDRGEGIYADLRVE